MNLSDIKRAGVAGGGTMGFGIAFNFAYWGYSTSIYDLNDEILEKSAQRVRKALDIFVTEGLRASERINYPVSGSGVIVMNHFSKFLNLRSLFSMGVICFFVSRTPF
jgi:3-hydroxybutyryl-CoA dehydrogenase